MSYECGASGLLNGVNCLLNGASCLLNAGSTCLRTSFLWGELSLGDLSLGRVVSNPHAVDEQHETASVNIK